MIPSTYTTRAATAALAGLALASLPAAVPPAWRALFAGLCLTAVALTVGKRAPAEPLEGPERWAPWALALFFLPVFTLPVAPGADMAMHTALARGLLDGGPALSPAWGDVTAPLYPRGFPALTALLAPLGLARAALAAAAIAYVVFWSGLAATLRALDTPWPRTTALLAVFLSRTPQAFFGWGGNPTALALGLALASAADLRMAPLLLAGAAAVHPMGACAGALPIALIALRRRAWLQGALAAAALAAVLSALALFGPHLSPRELAWIRDYAHGPEQTLRGPFPLSIFTSPGALGPAAILSGLAAAVLLVKGQRRPVVTAVLAMLALGLLLAALPLAGLYPARFAPLGLVALAPLWPKAAQALPARAVLTAAAFALALPGHIFWYQRAEPIATRADLAALECVATTVPAQEPVDGPYGDATQWLPALTGRAITRPHQHCSLFDETDAALAKQGRARWRFAGDRLRYPPNIDPPPASALQSCNGHLYELR